jgi:hypothetical protein
LRIDINNMNAGKVTLNSDHPDKKTNPLQNVEIKGSANKLKRYIVDAKWWAKWCDYCNFDHDDILIN